jgi:N-acyl-L-homoserine lactone synthetase
VARTANVPESATDEAKRRAAEALYRLQEEMFTTALSWQQSQPPGFEDMIIDIDGDVA